MLGLYVIFHDTLTPMACRLQEPGLSAAFPVYIFCCKKSGGLPGNCIKLWQLNFSGDRQ